MGIIDGIKRVWNAFRHEETTVYNYREIGPSYAFRPDRVPTSRTSEKSMVMALYNKLAVDVSMLDFKHALIDKEHDNRYLNTVDDALNKILTLQSNKDQTAREFIKDAVMSLIDEGCIALVPIDTKGANPFTSDQYDILSVRVGKIVEWFSDEVRVRVFDDRHQQHKDIILPKRMVAIIDNPFYQVMNAPNSIGQRLVRKLNLLDIIDEQSGSGKLDLIIQLPYIVKTETRRQQAEQRRKDIEEQLSGSKYGIAYTDGTEKITQLNRGVDNNILNQITYLTSMLFSQLGITEEVLNGTANESTMNNYLKRTVEPIVAAVVDEFKRKFLTKTARTQKQTIMYFLDPFKLIPTSNLAEIGDKFTRNEILSSNEIRQLIGFKPVKDPMADELRNKNLNIKDDQRFATTNNGEVYNQFANENLEEEN